MQFMFVLLLITCKVHPNLYIGEPLFVITSSYGMISAFFRAYINYSKLHHADLKCSLMSKQAVAIAEEI